MKAQGLTHLRAVPLHCLLASQVTFSEKRITWARGGLSVARSETPTLVHCILTKGLN